MSLNYQSEEYYRQFIELQEKLRKSEEERLKLEMKFYEMVQTTREEKQLHYRKLRAKYRRFLEEDRLRQDRNERILRTLERIEGRISAIKSKTERCKILREQFRAFAATRAATVSTAVNTDIISKTPEKLLASENAILDSYMRNMASRNLRDFLKEPSQLESHTSHCEDFDGRDVRPNYANSVASDIANSIYYHKKEKSDYIDLKKERRNTPWSGASSEEADTEEEKPVVTIKTEPFKEPILNTLQNDATMAVDYPALIESKSIVGDNYEQLISKIKISTPDDVTPQIDSVDDFPNPREDLQKPEAIVEQNVPKKLDCGPVELGDKYNIQPSDTETKEVDNSVVVSRVEDLSKNVTLEENEEKQEIVQELRNNTTSENEQALEVPNSKEDTRNSQYLEPTLKSEDLSQSPKQTLQTSYEDYNQTQITEKVPYDQYNQSDETGQGISAYEKTQHYDENGQVMPEYDQTQHYDENGQMMPEYDQSQHYDANGQAMPEYDQTHHYDENGQVMPEYNQTQHYDETGQIIPEYSQNQHYDENGQIIQYDQNQHYDENGQLIHQYDQSGHYDQNGQFVPEYQYDEHGQLIPQFDENGQPIQYYQDDPNYQGGYYDVQYDEHGVPIPQDGQDAHYYAPNVQDPENTNAVNYYESNARAEEVIKTKEELSLSSNLETQEPMKPSENDALDTENTKIEDVTRPVGERKGVENQNENVVKTNVMDLLETDSESTKLETKVSNESDFDLSNS